MIAKSAMLHGVAAAKRLQNSAENTADSYARAIKYRGGLEARLRSPRKSPPRRKTPEAAPDSGWLMGTVNTALEQTINV